MTTNYIPLQSATLSDMSKVMSLRLPDALAGMIEQEAIKQDRSQHQIVLRTLKDAFGIKAADTMLCDAPAGSSELAAQLSVAAASKKEPVFPREPKREAGMCTHGRERKFCVYCKKTEKQAGVRK